MMMGDVHNMILVFVIFIVNVILGYIIFGDQFRKKPIFHYRKFSESLETTATSVILYLLISSICLIFLVERIDITILNFVNFSYNQQFINSGLSFAICLLPTGYIIRCIYGVICFCINKIGEKHNKKYIDDINENEETLILIASCISLVIVAIVSERDYELAFFIIALILGKFFWVDSNIKKIICDIREMEISVFVIVILYWALSIYISTCFDKNAILINMVSIPVGFVFGILLYIFKPRNK